MRNKTNRLKWGSAVPTLVVSVLASPALVAQTQNDAPATEEVQEQDDGLGVIVVTAQKRAQSVQDIGLTVSAFGGERLAEASVTDVVDVAGLATNVQINYGLGNNFFNVRGLGLNEFTANLDAPVAVHVDEIYQSKGFMTGMALFDIERVEVLKGPQGDLFGRNTTGGAVNFFTNRPEDTFGAGFDISYGNYETFHGEAYVTGPITDEISARLSGYLTDQGRGFYFNQLRNDREGRVNEFALRGQLFWETDDASLLVSIHYGEDSSQLSPYEGVGNTDPNTGQLCAEYLDGTVRGNTPNCLRGLDLAFVPDMGLPGQYQPGEDDPFITQNNLTFEVNNWTFGGFVRYDHYFENAIFSSITGYERFSRDQREDSDGSPVQSVEVYWNNDIEQITQEFRLTSDFDHDNWSYVAGLFYERDDYDNRDYLTAFIPFLPNPGNPLNNYSLYNQKVDAFSAYIHVESQLTDNLRLIGGVRYTNERTEVNGGTRMGDGLISINGVEQPETIGPFFANAALAPGGNSRRDENVSYRFGAEFEPADDVLLYANLTTGFRSGGYSVAFASTQDQLVNLDPELITAYEAGFKTEFANRRVRVNGAIFRYDVQDGHIDVDVPGTPVPITINAPSAETFGAELDTTFQVFDGFEVNAGLGYTRSTIGSVADQVVGGVQVSDLGGNRRAFSPKWTFNGQARYETGLNDDFDMVLSTDWNWRSSQFLELNNQPSNRQDPYWVVNARATLKHSSGVSFSVWGKNITDTEYVVYLNDLPAFGWLLNGYAPPATYGVSLKFDF